MADITPVRKETWDGEQVKPADLSELVRDLAAKFLTISPRKTLEFEALYSEPMWIAFERNPAGVTCLRVRIAKDQEAVVLSGAAVHWVFDGARGIKVNSIDGMTPGGTSYLFTFEVVG